MRNTAFIAALVLLLLVFNGLVAQKELLLKSDNRIYLDLAPRDPRSIMQGDYMALRYAIETDIAAAADREGKKSGKAVLNVDENRVASFVRFDDGTPIDGNQVTVRFARHGTLRRFSGISIAPHSYMFQEGDAHKYSQARYAEIVVGGDGKCMLYALRDRDFNLMGKNKR